MIVRTAVRIYGRTRDISEEGMGATIPAELELDQMVELEFEFPSSPAPLAIFAQVRYRQGFEYGFQFINPTNEQLEIIRKNTRLLPMIR